jgi:hypothetical protein
MVNESKLRRWIRWHEGDITIVFFAVAAIFVVWLTH